MEKPKRYNNPSMEAFQDFVTNRDRVLGKTSEGHDIWFNAKPEGLSEASLDEAAKHHRSLRDQHAIRAAIAKSQGMHYFGNGLFQLAIHHDQQAMKYLNHKDLKKSEVPKPQKAPVKEPSIPNVNKTVGKQTVRQPKTAVKMPTIKMPKI